MEEEQLEGLKHGSWEDTLEFLTSDMNPAQIDIVRLADRYREYINQLDDRGLEVPAKAVRICAALLNMKTKVLYGEEQQEQEEPEEEIVEEVEEEPMIDEGPHIDLPVKAKPRRRVSFDELKDALEDALEVKKRREERRKQRMQMDETFEVEERDVRSRIDDLLDRITSKASRSKKISFESLLDQKDREEKISKFKNVLHLENDEKVKLIQDEFLGDLHVKPEESAEVN